MTEDSIRNTKHSEQAKLFGVAGKVVCVTGASSGLGRASAQYLAESGARVVGVARRQDKLSQWQEETQGETAAVVSDIADSAALAKTTEAIASHFGEPDIIINAAGMNPRQTADSVTRQSWHNTLELNVSAPFFLTQAFIPAMKKKRWGRVVNFASLQSRRAFHAGIAYGASKGAVEQLTRAMAEAWSASGIMVNAIAPGFFPTELTQAVFEDNQLRERNAQQTCIGRNGEMEDFYGPLLFLCSDASAYVTGQLLFVDGGFTAK